MTCGGVVRSSALDTVAKLKARALRIAPATTVRKGVEVIVFMMLSLDRVDKAVAVTGSIVARRSAALYRG